MSENEKIIRCQDLVISFFKEDYSKVGEWFFSDNPLLGNWSPSKMICEGKVDKLLKFIEDSLDENTKPEAKGE